MLPQVRLLNCTTGTCVVTDFRRWASGLHCSEHLASGHRTQSEYPSLPAWDLGPWRPRLAGEAPKRLTCHFWNAAGARSHCSGAVPDRAQEPRSAAPVAAWRTMRSPTSRRRTTSTSGRSRSSSSRSRLLEGTLALCLLLRAAPACALCAARLLLLSRPRLMPEPTVR